MSGSAGSAYAAEISALQTYQKHILTTLDEMCAGEAAMMVLSGVSTIVSGDGSNNSLGTFPEAVELSQTYSAVMEKLMTNFKEISELVTAMANVLGKSAQNYMDTEQQLTDSFNSIVQKYESQSGSFSTPGSPTATAPTGTSAQSGTSNSYYTATAAPNSTGSSTTTTTTQTTNSSENSIGEGNTSNASNDTSSEE